ncbi:hypothetical protein [Streptomyces lydicamycinicus]|uniref:hypothetical protein n=1 Tax=Streptomyces lydicamycinicus TaxID=1546107 RepID=UPI003C2EDA55
MGNVEAETFRPMGGDDDRSDDGATVGAKTEDDAAAFHLGECSRFDAIDLLGDPGVEIHGAGSDFVRC